MGERTSKRSKGVDVEPVRTIPTTCLETAENWDYSYTIYVTNDVKADQGLLKWAAQP